MNKVRLLFTALLLTATIQVSAMDTPERTTINRLFNKTAQSSMPEVLLSRLPSVIIIAVVVAGFIYGHRNSNDRGRKS